MTPNEAREAIYQRWAAQWGTTSPFVFDNETNTTLDAGIVAWARVSARNNGGGQETLGPTGHRGYLRRGSVFVQIFTPLNRGMKDSAVLAHQARAIFEGVSFSGIDFNNGQVREVGPDGKWYMTVVEAAFEYYETK